MFADQTEEQKLVSLKNYSVKDLVEIKINKPEDFLMIKETLTRIGIADKKNKVLFQVAYILHKKGRYYICHFKELLALDRQMFVVDEKDIQRRNTVTQLIEQWNLITVLDRKRIKDCVPHFHVKIVPHKEKKEWKLISPYQIGKV